MGDNKRGIVNAYIAASIVDNASLLKKRKKITLIIILCIFITFFLLSFFLYDLFTSYTGTLRVNFGIKLPSPNKEIFIASDSGGFPIQGTYYNILEYDDKGAEKLKKLNFWKNLDNETDLIAKRFAAHFWKDDHKLIEESCISQFDKNDQSNLNGLCLYYLKEIDTHWVLLVFDVNKKRVHVFENT